MSSQFTEEMSLTNLDAKQNEGDYRLLNWNLLLAPG